MKKWTDTKQTNIIQQSRKHTKHCGEKTIFRSQSNKRICTLSDCSLIGCCYNESKKKEWGTIAIGENRAATNR